MKMSARFFTKMHLLLVKFIPIGRINVAAIISFGNFVIVNDLDILFLVIGLTAQSFIAKQNRNLMLLTQKCTIAINVKQGSANFYAIRTGFSQNLCICIMYLFIMYFMYCILR